MITVVVYNEPKKVLKSDGWMDGCKVNGSKLRDYYSKSAFVDLLLSSDEITGAMQWIMQMNALKVRYYLKILK